MVAKQAKRAIGRRHELWPELKPESRLEEDLGAETTAAITKALLGAVMGEKHKLEAKGAGSA